MNFIDIPMITMVTKRYDVERTTFKNTKYSGDTDWIALWYYTNYDDTSNYIKIIISGDYHVTYPNPKHLTVQIQNEEGCVTPKLHLSRDETGHGYLQALAISGCRKLKSKKKQTRKTKRTHYKRKNRFKIGTI